MLDSLKQMGTFHSAKLYNHVFMKWLSLAPDTTIEEELFHYDKRLRPRLRTEENVSKQAPT